MGQASSRCPWTALPGPRTEPTRRNLAHAEEAYASPPPRYVEQEFRAYLRCGVFAHGFVRARRESCDRDLPVAFSCKGRGVCPSCAGRRMADTAARLTDRVLPAVPVRQWVLSLPFELRAAAAFRADVLAALARIFVDSVFRRYRAQPRDACGAVTFVQRFGSSLICTSTSMSSSSTASSPETTRARSRSMWRWSRRAPSSPRS